LQNFRLKTVNIPKKINRKNILKGLEIVSLLMYNA